jgi:hypothetical protein
MNYWNQSSIADLLSEIGQDDGIHFEGMFNGYCFGDWDKVNFFTIEDLQGNPIELRLEFETHDLANTAWRKCSAALTNPYEFYTRFDALPTILMIQFTE